MLKHGILGLLNYHEMTGYDIMEVFRDSLHYFWDAKTSQIYRELQGLEQRGWVDKTIVPQTGKPDKNVYAVTAAGREELLRWLGDDDLGLRQKTPILMKVFFMGERSDEENLHYFESVLKSCEIFLKGLESVPQSIDRYGEGIVQKEKARYWQMTLEYGRQSMQMHIRWAQDCIRRLKENQSDDW
ncbi:MAG: PadR family transcriptional regulator [Bacteroidales bacterium]|nr:PadR family transcriptional regulator [Bacteroidales bacterium]MCM1415085.1 PadR family transcriptional regulator [bacterium]MCM1424392.1 PadR family transcriptional regulator [bacterium]